MCSAIFRPEHRQIKNQEKMKMVKVFGPTNKKQYLECAIDPCTSIASGFDPEDYSIMLIIVYRTSVIVVHSYLHPFGGAIYSTRTVITSNRYYCSMIL